MAVKWSFDPGCWWDTAFVLKMFAVNQEGRLVEKGVEFFEGATFRKSTRCFVRGAPSKPCFSPAMIFSQQLKKK